MSGTLYRTPISHNQNCSGFTLRLSRNGSGEFCTVVVRVPGPMTQALCHWCFPERPWTAWRPGWDLGKLSTPDYLLGRLPHRQRSVSERGGCNSTIKPVPIGLGVLPTASAHRPTSSPSLHKTATAIDSFHFLLLRDFSVISLVRKPLARALQPATRLWILLQRIPLSDFGLSTPVDHGACGRL